MWTVGTEWKSLSSESGVDVHEDHARCRPRPRPPATSRRARSCRDRRRRSCRPPWPGRACRGSRARPRPAPRQLPRRRPRRRPGAVTGLAERHRHRGAGGLEAVRQLTVPSYVGIVDAATVVYHGEAWSAVEAPGPELPALTATKTPAAAALKNAMSSGCQHGGRRAAADRVVDDVDAVGDGRVDRGEQVAAAQMSSVVTSGSGPS